MTKLEFMIQESDLEVHLFRKSQWSKKRKIQNSDWLKLSMDVWQFVLAYFHMFIA